ncbi:MAG TPA: M14 family zinc carboxypeptidase [Balneolales bacterium]|nr:M14 family zinc carboxypeptidase [Balneolales bacterium]
MKHTSESLTQLVDQLMQRFENIREPALRHRLISHSDLIPLIRRLEGLDDFDIREIGKSVEQRSIYRISVGNGPVPVLMWSQMHGNEPTATMALFDLFRCLTLRGPLFEELSSLLLANLTLHIIPMVNPDGAERFQRRNALGIDLNRDALALQSPESQILMNQARSLKPTFGFNLHDQMRYHTPGLSPSPAALTFLAPPVDYNGIIPQNRRHAMQVISGLSNYLTSHLPDRIGSYKDDYEPRAFGDQFQQLGISTILIESGGYEGDSEKMIPRKWNLASYLHALGSIASQVYKTESLDGYYNLRDNQRKYFDLIIRNATIRHGGIDIRADIAINNNEKLDSHRRRLVHTAVIEDLGDLKGFHGYQKYDAHGYLVSPGKVYIPEESYDALPPVTDLLRKGYTDIYLNHEPDSFKEKWRPLNVCSSVNELSESQLRINEPANLHFSDGQSTRMLVINGEIVDPDSVTV